MHVCMLKIKADKKILKIDFTIRYGGFNPIACPFEDLLSDAPIFPLYRKYVNNNI